MSYDDTRKARWEMVLASESNQMTCPLGNLGQLNEEVGQLVEEVQLQQHS